MTSASTAFDYSGRIREGGLVARQALVLVMLGLLVIFDGMDNQLLGLIAHDMGRDLDIPISSFGMIFSSAFFGAITGALLLSPLADHHLGRKRVAMLGMVLAGACTIATAYAETLVQLLSIRFLTGFGLGAALPILISLASEFSPLRHSRLIVSLMLAFVPLGSALASILAKLVAGHGPWSLLLVIAGISTLVLTAGAALLIPESVTFLVRRRDHARAISSVHRLFGPSRIDAVLVDEDRAGGDRPDKQPLAQLLSARFRKLTALFWIAFLIDSAVLHLFLSWTPTLLIKSGLSSVEAVNAAAMFGLGGAIGTVGQAWLASRFDIYRVMYVEILVSIAAMLALSMVVHEPDMVDAMTFIIAATMCAFHTGLTNLVLETFPEAVKATALGWAIGVGRFGAAGAPLLIGFLIALKWHPSLLFIGASFLGVIAGAALIIVQLAVVRSAELQSFPNHPERRVKYGDARR
ncbi:MFS transporter [Rhizorhabdus dicambivorans]|nr:MFS transporter [Rhizorhabdus dicambivorans]